MRTGFKPWRKLESGRRVKNEHKFGFKGYKEPVLKSGTEERYPVSVLEISQLKGNHTKDFQLHPTQKPIELFKYLVLSYSNLGQVVLDPTCGSGTTAIAAYDTGRNFICVEQDATYHARAVKRLEQARAQLRFEEMVG